MVVRAKVPGATPTEQVTAWLARPVDRTSGRAVDGAQRQRLKNKLLLDVTVHALIGTGVAGKVWSATDRHGAWLAVKEVPVSSPADEAAFTHEVHMQRQMGSVTGAWFAHTKQHGTYGVLCMPPVDTTLRKLVHTFQGDALVLVMLARHLKALVQRLQRKGLVHGDLHLDNVGVVLTAGRRRVRLVTIDAAQAFHVADCPLARQDVRDADVFWVYRFVLLHCPCFLPALRAVGFPGTRHVLMVSGGDVPAPGTAAGRRVAGYLEQRTRYLQKLQAHCVQRTGGRQPVGVKRTR